MIFDILRNARPDLLDFHSLPSESELQSWSDLSLPEPHHSLKEIWLAYGTGTAFETEEFYSPAIDPDTGESAESINQGLWNRGLDENFIVFHSGLGGLTCIDNIGVVRQLDEDSLEEIRTFDSLEEWFQGVLLAEYAERYSLSNLQ